MTILPNFHVRISAQALNVARYVALVGIGIAVALQIASLVLGGFGSLVPRLVVVAILAVMAYVVDQRSSTFSPGKNVQIAAWVVAGIFVVLALGSLFVGGDSSLVGIAFTVLMAVLAVASAVVAAAPTSASAYQAVSDAISA